MINFTASFFFAITHLILHMADVKTGHLPRLISILRLFFLRSSNTYPTSSSNTFQIAKLPIFTLKNKKKIPKMGFKPEVSPIMKNLLRTHTWAKKTSS